MISMNEHGRAVRHARRSRNRLGLGEGEAAAAGGGGTTAGIQILAALAPLGYSIYKDRKDSKDVKREAQKDRMHEAAMQAEALKLAQAQREAAELQAKASAYQATEAKATVSKWVGIAAAGGAVLALVIVGTKLFGKTAATAPVKV